MDAVIVWTDTEEKEYRSRQLKYLEESRTSDTSDTGRSLTGLLLTIAGFLRYAPIERILLICPNEPSVIKPFLERNFPGKKDNFRAVTHKELFDGFEGFLPSFSEVAISTLIYRIRGLSDEFILASPGCFPINPMAMEHLRSGNSSIIYGRISRHGKIVSRKSKASPPAPLPALVMKHELEDCIASHHGLLSENLRYRFNSTRQTDILSLLASEGKAVARFHGPETLILRPCDDQSFRRKMAKARECDYLSHSPLSKFPGPQKMALIDFLCAWMEIRL